MLRNKLNDQDQRVIELRPLNPDFASEVIQPPDLADRLQGRVIEARITL